jgi:hypothetical protein
LRESFYGCDHRRNSSAHGVVNFVVVFDLTAIAVTRDNRLIATRNSAGAASAWWCPAKEASRIVRHARKDSGDIPAAARALGVPIGEHHTAMQKAADAVSQIDAAITDAASDRLAQARPSPAIRHEAPAGQERRLAPLAVFFVESGQEAAPLRTCWI